MAISPRRVGGPEKHDRGPRPTKRRIANTDKQRQALELRTAGMQYEEIAVQVGYANRGAAHNAVKGALKATLKEPAEYMRQLEDDRLNRLLQSVWPQAIAGELAAVGMALRIIAARRELLGLDAPKEARIELTPPTVSPAVEQQLEAARLAVQQQEAVIVGEIVDEASG